MITGLGSGRDLAQGKQGAFYQTLEEFHRYWERIDIIVPRVKGPVVHELFGNVFLHISPWPLWLHPWWFLKKAKELYRQQKFNLMTVQDFAPFYNGIAAWLLWRKIKVPYLLELHHLSGYPRASGLKEWFYRGLTKLLLAWDVAKASRVRIVNQTAMPALLRRLGIPSDKLVYIPAIYIDTKIFQPRPLAKQYDLIWAGRLEKNKNLDSLIKAVALLKKQFPLIRLLVVGVGSEQLALQRLVGYYGLKDNVVFDGWLKTAGDLVERLNQSKIFINPSFSEGGPRVALEAMACGLPVVTTRVGLMLDIIRDGENGVFCDWGPTAMTHAISNLLVNELQQKKMSSAGLVIAKRFEKKTAIMNYADKLKEILY